MTENHKTHFNTICSQLMQQGLLEEFQHVLHEMVFPGKTHLGAYNIIWAMECSVPDQWKQAMEQVITAQGATFSL